MSGLNEEHFEQWMQRLEKNDLPQADGSLCATVWTFDEKTEKETKEGVGFCCLGVGCKEMGLPEEKWKTLALAPLEFIEWLGIDISEADDLREDDTFDIYITEQIDGGERQSSAAEMNDNQVPFPEIARRFRAAKHTMKVGL